MQQTHLSVTKTVFVRSVSSLPQTLTVLLTNQLICTHVKNVSLTLRFLKIGSMKYTDYLHLSKCISCLQWDFRRENILIQRKPLHFNLLFFGLLLNIQPQSKPIPLVIGLFLTLKMCDCRAQPLPFTKTKPNLRLFQKTWRPRFLIFTSSPKQFSISITCPSVDIFQSIFIAHNLHCIREIAHIKNVLKYFSTYYSIHGFPF